jgi:hypothetical protein
MKRVVGRLSYNTKRQFLKVVTAFHFKAELFGKYLYSGITVLKSSRDYRSRYSDSAAGWTVRALNPGRGKRFFCFPKYPDRLWGQSSLLLNAYWGYIPGLNWPGRELESPNLMPRLRMSGVIMLLPL